MIKAIVFDLDGVYFQNGKKNFKDNIHSKYGVDKDFVEKIFLKSPEMIQYKQGKIGKEFWEFAIKEWNIKATPDQILKILQQGYELNEDAKSIIADVRKKGIKAIICSNNFKERISLLNERFDFLKDFDHIILSYEYGMLKPELFRKIPFKPKDVLIIDNSNELIEDAQKMGFETILCEDPNKLRILLKKQGIIL